MKTNKKQTSPAATTHEGGPAKRISPEQQLRRSVMACMLWEDTFYENGEDIGKRISSLVRELPAEQVSEIAIEAREKAKLRHAPLLVAREMARISKSYKRPEIVGQTIARIVQRPDELAEFLAIYWRDRKPEDKKGAPLSAQVKKGLAAAFKKFDEYAFAKYDRDGAVKLRDVMFLTCPKPNDIEQAAVFKRIAERELKIPDTWEVALSAGGKDADKRAIWTRLVTEKKLGALALLRNLRNMEQAGVDRDIIRAALKDCDASRVLPFRFISAAKYAPHFEPELEALMFKCVSGMEKLAGRTCILLDHSGSMQDRISGKSELTRLEAACGLAILAREVCEAADVMIFSDYLKELAPRRGFALRDAIMGAPWGGTYLDPALEVINKRPYDRLIVLTDEQVADAVRGPAAEKAYMINVASYKNGIGYKRWTHIDGWSEAVLQFIQEFERAE